MKHEWREIGGYISLKQALLDGVCRIYESMDCVGGYLSLPSYIQVNLFTLDGTLEFSKIKLNNIPSLPVWIYGYYVEDQNGNTHMQSVNYISYELDSVICYFDIRIRGDHINIDMEAMFFENREVYKNVIHQDVGKYTLLLMSRNKPLLIKGFLNHTRLIQTHFFLRAENTEFIWQSLFAKHISFAAELWLPPSSQFYSILINYLAVYISDGYTTALRDVQAEVVGKISAVGLREGPLAILNLFVLKFSKIYYISLKKSIEMKLVT